jgi:hypothetical protein
MDESVSLKKKSEVIYIIYVHNIIYVYMYVCMYVCMYVYIYIHTYIQMMSSTSQDSK